MLKEKNAKSLGYMGFQQGEAMIGKQMITSFRELY
jgi:hypothetical protein